MAAVIHELVMSCDLQGIKAAIKDMQQDGTDVQEEVNSHEFGGRGARSSVHAAAVRGRAEILQYLLKMKADPNNADDAGTTSMHFAADLGHSRVAYHLLQAGGDPSRRNGFGSRPTDKLVNNSWDTPEVLQGKDQIRRLIAGEHLPYEALRPEPDAPAEDKTVVSPVTSPSRRHRGGGDHLHAQAPAPSEATGGSDMLTPRVRMEKPGDTGLCAFLGGAVAQEVIKKTGKFTPVEQWIHHDDASLVQSSSGAGDYAGTRYAHQAAVLGSNFMESIKKQRVFLVGCGALGCEYLKGLALMGACSGADGKLIVTDMDRIEVSNLSRQFLFRQSDVGNPKSTSAARVVKGWNPDLQIEALEKGVGVTSEDFFDDTFWTSLDLCWNALDNVVARKYTDKCCLWYGLPLLESGTLGTKCNSDVFLPGLTKSYNDGVETDANETQIAMCTLRSFPFLPLHCIEFAKQAYFSDYMEFAPQQYESFRKDPAGFFEQLDAMSEAEQFKALKMIKGIIELQQAGAIDFDVCIKAAFNHYCRDFVTSIRDLVYNCDEIEKTTGKPFWTGTKRRPIEAKWDASAPPAEALEYLYATANCYAFMWKVPFVRNRLEFQKRVVQLNLQVPAWAPPSDKKVETEEDDGDKVDPAAIEALKAELYKVDPQSLRECEAHDFEKDDDTNFHIDFLTASTNLRASNYDIKHTERSTVKVTAGRIIPALATTTAMICGLVDMEFLKIVLGMHREEGALDKFYNANVNLATGLQAVELV
ncbi:UBA1 [Symbiodinium sp. CCMP2592]|nr:UBA1 [Symbiodinium sp. CCMP2592]